MRTCISKLNSSASVDWLWSIDLPAELLRWQDLHQGLGRGRIVVVLSSNQGRQSMCTRLLAMAQPKNRTTTIIYQEWIESTSYNSAWPLMSNADYAVSTLVAICAHETEKGREPELIDQESKSMRGAAQCSKTKRHNSQLSASVLPPRTLFFPSCWHCLPLGVLTPWTAAMAAYSSTSAMT